MFCGKCGAYNDEGSRFCASCGNVFEADFPPQSQQTPAYGFTPSQPDSKAKGKGKKTGLIAIVSVLLVVVLALLGVFAVSSQNNKPEKVLEKYILASSEIDVDKMSKYSAINYTNLFDEAIAFHADEEGISKDEAAEELFGAMFDYYDVDSYKEYFKELGKEAKEEIEDEYGDDYKITVRVINQKKLKSAEKKDLIEEMTDLFEDIFDSYNYSKIFKPDKIKEAIEMDVKLTIRGSEGKDTDEATFTLVKIGSKWGVLDPNFIEGFSNQF